MNNKKIIIQNNNNDYTKLYKINDDDYENIKNMFLYYDINYNNKIESKYIIKILNMVNTLIYYLLQ